MWHGTSQYDLQHRAKTECAPLIDSYIYPIQQHNGIESNVVSYRRVFEQGTMSRLESSNDYFILVAVNRMGDRARPIILCSITLQVCLLAPSF